jgi:hypothetical protein
VDDRVQRLGVVQLGGDAPDRVAVGEVADDEVRTALDERLQVHGAFVVAGVHDDVVPGGQQCAGGQAAEPVRGPGDQDAAHDHTATATLDLAESMTAQPPVARPGTCCMDCLLSLVGPFRTRLVARPSPERGRAGGSCAPASAGLARPRMSARARSASGPSVRR